MITPLMNVFKQLALVLILLTATKLSAQSELDAYVSEGLQNNIVVQQKNIELQRAMLALQDAKALFLPSVDLKFDYQSGEGGRSINFPIGDLLNPVYGTLNQMTQSTAFPQLQNIQTYFFPYQFYDARVRTSVPIVNADIYYNRKLQHNKVKIAEYEVETYKKELAKNIRQAYYTYAKAWKVLDVYSSAMELAREAVRVNERLLANGAAVNAYVVRAESDLQQLQAKQTAAQQQKENAAYYFNFLLNRAMSEPINLGTEPSLEDAQILGKSSQAFAASQRTEILALKESVGLYQTLYDMKKNYWIPQIGGFLDLGSQESHWKRNSNSTYYFFGVQMNIPLFAGGRNAIKSKDAKLGFDFQQRELEYVNKQLELSAAVAKSAVIASYSNYTACEKQVASARTYYNLVERGYREGVNTFIETVDARNQLTQILLQQAILKYDVLIALAALEREFGN